MLGVARGEGHFEGLLGLLEASGGEEQFTDVGQGPRLLIGIGHGRGRTVGGERIVQLAEPGEHQTEVDRRVGQAFGDGDPERRFGGFRVAGPREQIAQVVGGPHPGDGRGLCDRLPVRPFRSGAIASTGEEHGQIERRLTAL